VADIVDRFRTARIVPVIVIEDASKGPELAGALVDGGLPLAEITFRTAAAADAIRRITEARDDILVGAGTVLTPKQVDDALTAGAQFIVAPGFSPAVVERCRERSARVFPGVCTPTEIEAALAHDLRVLKFFPAEPMGGVDFLKAISAPYGQVSFIPTGGVNAANVQQYLALKSVVACGGSWMAPSDWIAAEQFDRIRAATADAVKAAMGKSA
jgi:2-dehydro-3-deoxyphosphogluconate aldolase/(4S)-4-hydroxy-2-oxoglutarate aldolase